MSVPDKVIIGTVAGRVSQAKETAKTKTLFWENDYHAEKIKDVQGS